MFLKFVMGNIIKHKVLFILIGIMVTFFTFYLVIGMNTAFSVSSSLKNALAESISGDAILINAKEKRFDILFKEGEAAYVFFDNWQEVAEYIKTLPYVEVVSPRMRVTGFAQSEKNSIGMFFIGVDPEAEQRLLPARYMDNGQFIKNEREVTMYFGHADELSMKPGEELILQTGTIDGYTNTKRVKLTGTYDYNDIAIYGNISCFAFTTLEFLNSVLCTEKLMASEISVKFNAEGSIAGLKKDLDKKFGKTVRVISPVDSSPLVSGINSLVQFFTYFIVIILLALVYLCSSFLINLTIEMRRKEIGLYQAFGVHNIKISLAFGAEFLFIVLLFGLIGILLVGIVMNFLSTNGIEASIFPLKLIFGKPVLKIENYIISFAGTAGLLFFSVLINTVTIILKLMKFNPVDIMRDA